MVMSLAHALPVGKGRGAAEAVGHAVVGMPDRGSAERDGTVLVAQGDQLRQAGREGRAWESIATRRPVVGAV